MKRTFRHLMADTRGDGVDRRAERGCGLGGEGHEENRACPKNGRNSQRSAETRAQAQHRSRQLPKGRRPTTNCQLTTPASKTSHRLGSRDLGIGILGVGRWSLEVVRWELAAVSSIPPCTLCAREA